MKKLFLLVAALTFLGAGCVATSSTDSDFPDEFWGVGSWRFATGSQIAYGATGEATITLHFTKKYEDAESKQYEVEGTVAYVEPVSCAYYVPSGWLCPTPTCAVTSTSPGKISGVALEQDGVLTVKPKWLNKTYPSEAIATSCTPGTTHATNTGTMLQQTMQTTGGIINNNWTIDAKDALFIDDVPSEGTSEKTASITFTTSLAGYGDGAGLLGLYRNAP